MRIFWLTMAALFFFAACALGQSLTPLNLTFTWDDGTPMNGGFIIRNAVTGTNVLAVTITNGAWKGNVSIPPNGIYGGEFDFADAAGVAHTLGYSQLATGTNINQLALAYLGGQQINIVIGRATNALVGVPKLTPLFMPLFENMAGPAASYMDSLGNAWASVTCPSSSNSYTTTHAITGTPDQALYQKECYGPMTFTFPVANGAHTVTLKLSELYWNATGKRKFNVSINGASVLTNFDLFAACGQFTQCDQMFPVNVTTGQVVIGFTNGTADNAKIDAISIQ